MYNRYVPQSDGSFRKNQLPDAQVSKSPEPNQDPNSIPSPVPPQPQAGNPPPRNIAPHPGGGMGNILNGLLPQSFDTEDMIIILLLLLLGNGGKDQNATFLTLVIYLFL